MLNARQREQCRAIAAALDAGDQRPWLKAAPSLSVEAKGLIWDMRAHVIAAGGRASKAGAVLNQSGSKPPRPPRVETEFRDLDYWADDDQDDGGDDGDEAETVPCQVCNGRGRDTAGNVCAVCNGSGVAPLDDDNEDDDDEFKDD